MSAEAVGRHMPAVITLDDLAAMISADTHGRRYETSPEGVLSVVPPLTASTPSSPLDSWAWLITAGVPLDQLMQVAGIRIPGPEGDGGRIPDLSVWAEGSADAAGLAVADVAGGSPARALSLP